VAAATVTAVTRAAVRRGVLTAFIVLTIRAPFLSIREDVRVRYTQCS
jgi:ribosomal protein S12